MPGPGAEKAYGLLRQAMDKAGKVAIAKVVIRSKESLVAIRPTGRVMTMSTMLFHDEVIDGEDLDEAPDGEAKASKRELDDGQQLIESLASEFEPERYRDEYRERVLELIERKAQGEEIAVAPAPEQPAKVPDLMAALEASISAVKDRDAEGNGAGASKRGKSGSARGKRSSKTPAAKRGGAAKTSKRKSAAK